MDRYPSIESVRENKQYLCNGQIINTTNCSGILSESENNFYDGYILECPNSEEGFKTLQDALLNRQSGCKVRERQKDLVYVEDDGKNYIDATCQHIRDMFPSCTLPEPCDFNPCSDDTYTCTNSGTKAICTTTGDLNSTCKTGLSERLSYTSYSCDIQIPEASCPKDTTFNTNVAKFCKENNPIVQELQIGNDETKPFQVGKYIHFMFKASDQISTSTRLEFGDAIIIYIRQGQIQINEVELLQACPLYDLDCHNTWSYQKDTWYHIELEITEICF